MRPLLVIIRWSARSATRCRWSLGQTSAVRMVSLRLLVSFGGKRIDRRTDAEVKCDCNTEQHFKWFSGYIKKISVLSPDMISSVSCLFLGVCLPKSSLSPTTLLLLTFFPPASSTQRSVVIGWNQAAVRMRREKRSAIIGEGKHF